MDSKRNKQDDLPPLPAPVTATSDHDLRRNWSELPELALHSISSRLLSIPDFLSFSSVCTSWNSSTSTDHSTSFPPLLLLPVLPAPPPLPTNPNPNPDPFLRRRNCRYHHNHPPSRFLLQTLEEEEEAKRRSFRSKIPSETLALPCLGCTDGCLVFLSARNNLLILADAFSGALRRAVFPPGSPRPRIALFIGTDLLLASDSVVLSYRPQTDTWSQLDHGATSLAAFGENQVYSIDPAFNRIVVIESTAEDDAASVRSTPTEVSLPQLPGNSTLCRDLGHRLVACDGDLLLLRVRRLTPIRRTLDVFRLDSGAWAEVESLGDWCFFLDAVGSSAAACLHPERWGGRSNCVYVTGPGCDSWVAVPLDGDRQFVINDRGGNNRRVFDMVNHDFVHEFDIGDDNNEGGGHGFNLGNPNLIHGFFMANHDRMHGSKVPRWPSPAWVYPSTLHGRK